MKLPATIGLHSTPFDSKSFTTMSLWPASLSSSTIEKPNQLELPISFCVVMGRSLNFSLKYSAFLTLIFLSKVVFHWRIVRFGFSQSIYNSVIFRESPIGLTLAYSSISCTTL